MMKMPTRTFRIAYDPIYAHPLPEGHRFPMLKYELIPGQLMHEGTIDASSLFVPSPCDDDSILLAHQAEYLQRLNDQTLSDREQRVIGFPQSPALTLREKIITQGTIDCARFAIRNGVAMNVAGGTHHAFADHGEGFCLLNDFAVAARLLISTGEVRRVVIVDLDVHQGNGRQVSFPEIQQYSRSVCMGHTTILSGRRSLIWISLWLMASQMQHISVCWRNICRRSWMPNNLISFFIYRAWIFYRPTASGN